MTSEQGRIYSTRISNSINHKEKVINSTKLELRTSLHPRMPESKMQATGRKKIFTTHITNKKLTSRIYKKYPQSHTERKHTCVRAHMDKRHDQAKNTS